MFKKILFILILPFFLYAQWTDPRPKSIQLWHLNTSFFDSLGNVVRDSVAALSADNVTITNSGGTFRQKVLFDSSYFASLAADSSGALVMLKSLGVGGYGGGPFNWLASGYIEDNINVFAGSSGYFVRDFAVGGSKVYRAKDFATIQAAINAAPAGYTVMIEAGEYDQAITLKDSVNLVGRGSVYINYTSNSAGPTITDNGADCRVDIWNLNVRRSPASGSSPGNDNALRISGNSKIFTNSTFYSEQGDAIYKTDGWLRGAYGETGAEKIGLVNNGGTIEYCTGVSPYEGISNHDSALVSLGVSYGSTGSAIGFGNAGVAMNCTGKSINHSGIYNHDDATGVGKLVGCVGYSVNHYGIHNDRVAINCAGYSENSYGFYSTGQSFNCSGAATAGDGFGIADSNAVFCSGYSKNGRGIVANAGNLYNCNATSENNHGILITSNTVQLIGGVYVTNASGFYHPVYLNAAAGVGAGVRIANVTTIGGANGIYANVNDTYVGLTGGTSANILGDKIIVDGSRALHSNVSDRVFRFEKWLTSATNDTLVLGVLPARAIVLDANVYVQQAFNSATSDTISVGYDTASEAYIQNIGVQSVGVKTVDAGTTYGIADATARTVKIYLKSAGGSLSTGKVSVILTWTNSRAIP